MLLERAGLTIAEKLGLTDRTDCLCRIFNRIKAENGGAMPLIDDWQSMYDELGCGSTD